MSQPDMTTSVRPALSRAAIVDAALDLIDGVDVESN